MKNTYLRGLKSIFSMLCILASFLTYSQTNPIKGKVLDENKEPLLGASILVKNSNIGTVTDFNGDFTLNNVENGSTLIISYVGFLKKEVPAETGQTYTLVMDASQLSEVIVTAENRNISSQKVSIAMDLIGGPELNNKGITDLVQIQTLAPSLNISQNTVFNQITVRGVGSHDGAAELSDQAITIGIDGEFINRPVALNTSLFDLERIEVLKGPQGTLYGRNATAGAVNIVARKPILNKTSGEIRARYGNYNATKLNTSLNLPLGKTIAIRFAGMLDKHAGYRDGGAIGKIDNADNLAGRLGLLFKPSDAFTAYIAGEYTKTDQQAPSQYGVNVAGADSTLIGSTTRNFETDLPEDFDVATAGFLKINQRALRGKLSYNFRNTTLSYSGGFRNVSMSGYQPLNGFLPEMFSFDNQLSYKTYNNELRLNGESDKLLWQVGYFYGDESQDVARGLILPVAAGAFGGEVPYLNFSLYDVNSTTSAFFGQATYKFNEKLAFTFGLRNTTDKKSRKGSQLTTAPFGPPGTPAYFYPNAPSDPDGAGMTRNPGEGNWNQTTWLTNLDYQIDDDKLLYAKVSTGYKAGGFDNVGEYNPEKITAFELGSKNKFANNRLRLNGSLFHYNYSDQQVSVFISTQVGAAIKNAASTKISGLEIDGEYAVSNNDRLRFSMNYLDAKFGTFPTTENVVGGDPLIVDLKGNSPVQSPKLTLTAGYSHDFNFGENKLTAAINSIYKSDYYLSPFNGKADKQDAFTNTSFRLTYSHKSGNWDLGAFVQNIEDKRILTYAAFTGGGIDIYNFIFGSPRIIGIQGSIKF